MFLLVWYVTLSRAADQAFRVGSYGVAVTASPPPPGLRAETGQLLRLAAPVIVSQFSLNALALISTAVIGRLGAGQSDQARRSAEKKALAGAIRSESMRGIRAARPRDRPWRWAQAARRSLGLNLHVAVNGTIHAFISTGC